MIRRKQILAIVLALSVVLAGRGYAMESQVLEVEDPWIRAVPPVVQHSAAYMVLKNNGDGDVVIKSVTSDVAEYVEMHSMSMQDDRMTMRKEEEIRIPAGELFKLEPSGWHIMLINLVQPLKSNEEVSLQLNFADGRQQTVTATVKRMDMMWEEKGSNHGSQKGSHHGSSTENHKGSH